MASVPEPEPGSRARLQVTNLADKETVSQRCLLVTGTCHDYSDVEDFVAVTARDGFSHGFDRSAGQQNWPVADGSFKCLVMLQPGPNKVDFELRHKGRVCGTQRLIIQYQPLLQLPPLHLAIMVAKDSPLLIDCPPSKRGAISSAHSSLDAAIAKLRMAAYMWQALVAEDLRVRGLGRRSFRLDEQWGRATTTAASLQCDQGTPSMGAVADVHVVRSDKTVKELRDPSLQNFRRPAGNGLVKCFQECLAAHGAPFDSFARPVVAGLVLDTHHSPERSFTLGHVANAYHNPIGVSLGTFGSHTTYAWPRFMEEIPSCLLDLAPTGDSMANDRGQCSNMQGACCFGQASMLEEIQRAFGATDIATGKGINYAKQWRHAFLSLKSSTAGADVPAAALQPPPPTFGWGLHGALQAVRTEHFRLPGDRILSRTQRTSNISMRCVLDEHDNPCLEASCAAGLARLRFVCHPDQVVKEIDFCRQQPETSDFDFDAINTPGPTAYTLSAAVLAEELDRSKPVTVEALSKHGKQSTVRNLWALLADTPFIKVPGTTLVLAKRSVKSTQVERDEGSRSWWQWALLLKRRHRDGGAGSSRLAHAQRIDLRVGATMDGAVVHYSDRTRCNCGVASQAHYGGHQQQERALSEQEAFGIARVSVNRGSRPGWGSLDGCRITLEGGDAWGTLNDGNGGGGEVEHLDCADDERIIGFYGRSDTGSGYAHEFGIITAPADVVDSDEGLPREVYDMPELQNTNGGQELAQNPDTDSDSESDEYSEVDEDEGDADPDHEAGG